MRVGHCRDTGMAWKIWSMDVGTHEAGGIYLFENDEALLSFLEGPIVGVLKENQLLSDLSSKQFSVLEKLPAETRGPLVAVSRRKTFN